MKKQLMMTSWSMNTVVNLIEIIKIETNSVLADKNRIIVEERNLHPDRNRINLNEIKDDENAGLL